MLEDIPPVWSRWPIIYSLWRARFDVAIDLELALHLCRMTGIFSALSTINFHARLDLYMYGTS